MSSIIHKIHEQMDDEIINKNIEWLSTLSNKIANINPESYEFKELQWLITNKEKILKNRKLIELIG